MIPANALHEERKELTLFLPLIYSTNIYRIWHALGDRSENTESKNSCRPGVDTLARDTDNKQTAHKGRGERDGSVRGQDGLIGVLVVGPVFAMSGQERSY